MTYLQNILRWLPRVAPDCEVEVCLPTATRFQLSRLALPTSVSLWEYPYRSTDGIARLFFDNVQLPAHLRKIDADVLFSSTGFASLYAPCPQVLLIRNPVYFDPLFRQAYHSLGRSTSRHTLRRWLSVLSARVSDFVIFPTEDMRSAVGKYVQLNSAKVAAIHYGFDETTFVGNDEASPNFIRLLDEWRSDGCFILLNVSTYAVHKNFETVAEALPDLKSRGFRLRLLTTISRDKTSDLTEYERLRSRVRELEIEEEFVELGYVPYQHLFQLYQRADAFIFPSFTESFGHSMVEAMAAGLPVVAAGTGVNREVCGSAGRYFDTFDTKDCADKIAQVIANPSLREEMRRASLERASHFSWERYANDLMDVFRLATSDRRRTLSVFPGQRVGEGVGS